MPNQSRQLAAIMFTDIVGYTKLMGENEQEALQLLRKNRHLHKSIIKRHSGKWLKEMGDGTLVSFKTTSDAVYCAGELMKACNNDNIMLRIGIHQGEVTMENGDIFGDGVNVASRLEPLADPGQILVSEPIYRNVKNKEGITTTFLKETKLKNVDEPIRVHMVAVDILIDSHLVSKSPISKKPFIIAAGLAVTILIIYSLSNYFAIEKPTEPISIKTTIAVLAFDDQSPDGDQEWLGDGMADEILNLLAKVNGIQVTGKTSSFSFKGKGATIPEIGEALNVNTILEGSVSKVGNRLRITAQLIDVKTDKHIWSDKYDRDASEIFDIIDDVAQSIAGSLMSELSIEETKNIGMVYRPDPEAYKYFALAEKIYLDDYVSDLDDSLFLPIKDLYLKAIDIDPDYMDALAGLANLYYTYGQFGGSMEIDFVKADSILNVAYQKDPTSPYVLYLKGWRSMDDFDLDSAFFFLSEAYKINPVHSASINLPNACFNAGFFDLTIDLCRRYLADDPLNKTNAAHLVMALVDCGQAEEARNQAIKLLEFDEDHLFGNRYLFFNTLIADKNFNEAKALLNKIGKLQHSEELIKWGETLILAAQGKKHEVLKRSPDNLFVYLLLDMREEALAKIDSIISSTDFKYIGFYGYLSLKGHPIFANIREEPQFQQWLKEAKIVHEEHVRKYYHLFDD